jgi:hypothetical protein
MVSFNVTGGGVTPTGTVSITGADVNCTITLSGGSGGCNVVFNTTGLLKPLTATYSGDSNYSGSFVSTTHDVVLASTTTVTSIVAEPSLPGIAITINVLVTGAAGSPAGTVTITGGEGPISCTTAALVAGVGSCSLNFGTAGVKLLTATYSGQVGVYSPSSTTATHTVSKTDSVTTILPVVLPVHPFASTVVNVTVSTVAGADPTGSVGISISGGQPSTCTLTLVPGAPPHGTCNIVFNAVGTYTITAIYSGDGSHWSSSNTLSVLVN